MEKQTLEDGLVTFFTADHHNCDGLWAQFEAACESDPKAAAAAFAAFDGATRLHLMLEEDVIFPEFERRTGIAGGPTAMMRSEHEKMRALLEKIAQAASEEQWEDALDHGDTLFLLTQQHNQKEEAMLYPMAEKAIGADWAEVAMSIDEKRST